MKHLLYLFVFSIVVGLTAVSAQVIELGLAGSGTARVTDPAASKGEAVAVRLTAPTQWPLLKTPLAPGLYRFTLRVQSHLPKDYDVTRLILKLQLRDGDDTLFELPVNWTVLDGRPDTYTALVREFSVTRPVQPVLVFDSQIKALPPGQKKRPVQPHKKISVLDEAPEPAVTDELTASLADETAKPVAEFKEPSMLLDTAEFQLINDALVVEKVWPEKVHVYPGGEANPVTVTVRNYRPQPATATVRLTMRAGLDEASAPQETSVTVPGNGTATCRFDWKSGTREYGYGACAELIVAGKPVHSATEYFSVSTPVWKTSLQGNGFLTWYGREGEFPEHVAEARKSYINVEEAFSWQPSSWTDLNPTTEVWHTGQGNAHNSLKGLRLWMSLSHSNGIKLTTYNWPTASGPVGLEWARRYPELWCYGDVGPGRGSFDLEDLRLYDITHARPELKHYQQGNWYSVFVNMGRQGTIDWGASEIIKSAKNFGWDGVRFDFPPGWSAMDAAEMHAEFAAAGVTNVMAKLLPEYYGITTGAWDGVAVSARNFRYFRHRFFTEVSSNFAVSYNYGLPDKDIVNFDPRNNQKTYAEACAQGGQIMDEAIRGSRSWKGYREEALKQAGVARQCGGFHECFPAEAASFRAYSAIFTFAAASHPYTWYGWGPSMPGNYTAFMTRYGEYCWDIAFKPIAPDDFTVDEKLLWKPYLRSRRTATGATQTVVQLISPPLNDDVAPVTGAQSTPWATGITVHKRGTAPPVVWRLSAEPDVQCEKLEPHREGDGFTVTIPEHRLWTVLVWEEAAQ